MEQPAGYRSAVTVTKSDTVNHSGLAGGPKVIADALWVGGAGIVALVLIDGTVVNITCVAGSLLPVRSIRVNATDTTATVMTALFL